MNRHTALCLDLSVGIGLLSVDTYTLIHIIDTYVHTYMYVLIYLYIFVYIYIYTQIYANMYT